MSKTTDDAETPTERDLELAYEDALRESEAAYAVADFGELINHASAHGGFDGLSERHWQAVGVAIKQLGERLYEGSISRRLQDATDQLMDARQRQEVQS